MWYRYRPAAENRELIDRVHTLTTPVCHCYYLLSQQPPSPPAGSSGSGEVGNRGGRRFWLAASVAARVALEDDAGWRVVALIYYILVFFFVISNYASVYRRITHGSECVVQKKTSWIGVSWPCDKQALMFRGCYSVWFHATGCHVETYAAPQKK
jgi:hypothetical protein